jgi:hypothetical protein
MPTRNRNQLLSAAEIPKERARVAGNSLLDAGKMLYQNGTDTKPEFYGNCAELAWVALYVAHQYFHVEEKYLFFLGFDKETGGLVKRKFNHGIAVLGNCEGSKFVGEVAFCDPWMNIACLCDDYAALASEKLKTWTRQGKRLAVAKSSILSSSQEWVEPTNGAIAGFWGCDKIAVYKCTDPVILA